MPIRRRGRPSHRTRGSSDDRDCGFKTGGRLWDYLLRFAIAVTGFHAAVDAGRTTVGRLGGPNPGQKRNFDSSVHQSESRHSARTRLPPCSRNRTRLHTERRVREVHQNGFIHSAPRFSDPSRGRGRRRCLKTLCACSAEKSQGFRKPEISLIRGNSRSRRSPPSIFLSQPYVVFSQIFGCISTKLQNRRCTEREFFNRIGQLATFRRSGQVRRQGWPDEPG
jgi:hypothetical protein